jgi:hypothetical protein
VLQQSAISVGAALGPGLATARSSPGMSLQPPCSNTASKQVQQQPRAAVSSHNASSRPWWRGWGAPLGAICRHCALFHTHDAVGVLLSLCLHGKSHRLVCVLVPWGHHNLRMCTGCSKAA